MQPEALGKTPPPLPSNASSPEPPNTFASGTGLLRTLSVVAAICTMLSAARMSYLELGAKSAVGVNTVLTIIGFLLVRQMVKRGSSVYASAFAWFTVLMAASTASLVVDASGVWPKQEEWQPTIWLHQGWMAFHLALLLASWEMLRRYKLSSLVGPLVVGIGYLLMECLRYFLQLPDEHWDFRIESIAVFGALGALLAIRLLRAPETKPMGFWLLVFCAPALAFRAWLAIIMFGAKVACCGE